MMGLEEYVAMAQMMKAFPVARTEKEWRRRLTPEQYQVMRAHGTEAPGSCALLFEKRPGTFQCAGCGHRSLDPSSSLKVEPARRASMILSRAPSRLPQTIACRI